MTPGTRIRPEGAIHHSTFDFFNRGLVALDVDGLPCHFPVEMHSLTAYREVSEDHPADRHFVDDRVEPLDKQHFVVQCLTRNAHALALHHECRIRHHGGQCLRGLRESLLARMAQATHPDVGLMIEMLPSGQGVRHFFAYLESIPPLEPAWRRQAT